MRRGERGRGGRRTPGRGRPGAHAPLAALALLAAAAWLWVGVAAAAGSGAVVSTDPSFRSRLGQALLGPKPAKAVGAVAIDLVSGEVIFEHEADAALVPASNAKLWTTAAALDLLGPEYEFTTTLSGRGRREGDSWRGDLKVTGGGDPSLSARFHDGRPEAVLEKWAGDLRGGGIRRVTGDVIIDDSFFDDEGKHDTWPENDPSKWYLAEVGALSLNENCVDLVVRPDGDGAGIDSTPDTAYIEFENTCKLTTERKDHVINVSRREGSNTFRVWGKVWANSTGYSGSFAIHDPGMFFGTVWMEVLEREGIDVEGKLRRAVGEDASGKWLKLAEHRSPLLRSVTVANTRSQNFHAEQILKTIGRVKKGEGSFAAGAAAVREYLVGAGVPGEGVRIVDGSGLSDENAVTARALVTLLRHAASRKHGRAFVESLASSGDPEGTLKRRLRSKEMLGMVRAKTGSLRGVSCLSGYVHTKHGETVAFSILMNQARSVGVARQAQDAFCEVLRDYVSD